MRQVVLLSSTLTLLLAGIDTQKIVIEAKDVPLAKDEIRFTRQQDLAQILSQTTPEINMIRASAIGNDIVLRGFKRDDINVLIDGAKIYGACPNRMDPPLMHISIADVEKIEVKEGPFDVKNFGSMGGMVNVATSEPKKGFYAGADLVYGSFDYNKEDISVSGSDGKVGVSIGATHESSDQYKDGSGKTLVEQNWAKLGKKDPNSYQEKYKDLKAYTRGAVRAKGVYHINETQSFKFSFFGDKAQNVLYPAFQMDALLDKTIMLNGSYTIKNLGLFSKELTLQGYYSSVLHDMGTKFRVSALNPMTYRTHHVKSQIKGVKAINHFVVANWNMEVGLDGSKRRWNGICLSEPTKKPKQVRIPNVTTDNGAIFAKLAKKFGSLGFEVALRYDDTSIKAHNLSDPTIKNIAAIGNYYKNRDSRDFSDISGYLNFSLPTKIGRWTFSLGQGIRVPDAQELYFIGFMKGNWTRKGNPNLKESKNREVDLRWHQEFENLQLQTALFYSKVKDYIYAYRTNKGQTKYYLTWANIDAHFYGGSIKANYALGDFWMAEGALSWQRGVKDDLIARQSDKDMAMVPPLRGRFALSFDNGELYGMIETLFSGSYKNVDEDNGEQEIGGWGVVNMKVSKDMGQNIKLNIGVDNIFDKTYALNNTYVGRSLVGGRTPVLINEPGRFFYANLNFRF